MLYSVKAGLVEGPIVSPDGCGNGGLELRELKVVRYVTLFSSLSLDCVKLCFLQRFRQRVVIWILLTLVI